MSVLKYFIVLCAIFGLFDLAYSVELTFELPDSAKQCFFQEIEEGVESTIEFQVKKFFEKVTLFKRISSLQSLQKIFRDSACFFLFPVIFYFLYNIQIHRNNNQFLFCKAKPQVSNFLAQYQVYIFLQTSDCVFNT